MESTRGNLLKRFKMVFICILLVGVVVSVLVVLEPVTVTVHVSPHPRYKATYNENINLTNTSEIFAQNNITAKIMNDHYLAGYYEITLGNKTFDVRFDFRNWSNSSQNSTIDLWIVGVEGENTDGLYVGAENRKALNASMQKLTTILNESCGFVPVSIEYYEIEEGIPLSMPPLKSKP